MYKLLQNECLRDAWDKDLKIGAGEIVREELLEIGKDTYLRYQGDIVTVSVLAKTIEEAIEKSGCKPK